MTKKEGIESSIEKWESIRLDLVAKKKQKYEYTYWDSCGYCEYRKQECEKQWENFVCWDCSLQSHTYKFRPICGWAYRTLELADRGKYEEALECCDIVLDFMREDLKK
jgi:hypothetical protein